MKHNTMATGAGGGQQRPPEYFEPIEEPAPASTDPQPSASLKK